ncbi:MAG: superoxide dismutase [Patescibacteria group bacterium]
MEKNKFYTLPELSYGYNGLEPYISEQQLTIHHQKHHQAYVNGANAILEKIDKSRKESAELDLKSTLKELSFNIGGHLLHSLFWENLTPGDKGGGEPKGALADLIKNEFGGFERFKKEFSQTALSVEGSGWAALTFCDQTQRLMPMQIEKHNVNIYPAFKILMVLDVFEHAYYLDHKNERAKFIEAFWNIVNWDVIAKRIGI